MSYAGRFAGQRAIITGGASGIGLAAAKRLAKEGASVCLWDLSGEALDGAASGIGGAAFGVRVDVSSWPEVERAMTESLARLGGLEILVASAGITGPNETVRDYPVDKWRQVIDVNLNGLFYCNK